MKAYLKNYRQAPRKVRLVTDLVKGKSVEEAVSILDFLPKRAGIPVKKLILGAVANASGLGIERKNLFIKEIQVDKGVIMKRIRPAAMGVAHRINKRTSHINLILGEKTQTVAKTATKKKAKKESNDKAGKRKLKSKGETVKK